MHANTNKCMPIQTNTCQFKQIHANTNKYMPIQTDAKRWVEIRAQYFQDCIDCINMSVCFFKYKHNTCQYKQIQGQYRPNTIIIKSKPVVGNPCVLVCICMYLHVFACILHVFACISLYCGGVADHRLTSMLYCMYHMYLYVFCMYFVCICMCSACIYKQYTNKYEHTSQYKQNTNTEFMLVLCM
jgi:hypothetical protein